MMASARQESKSASKTEINVNVMDLPNEIWQVIFDLLSAQDLKSLRLVNKEWKEKIDEIATFSVEFNDGLPEATLDRLYQLRIRSCSIMLKGSFEPRFDFPMLVKDVTFSSVSSETLTKVLNTCTQVEKLKFFLTLAADNLFDPATDYSSVLHLRTLKEIDVGILTIGQRTPTSRSSIFDTLFVRNLNTALHFDALEKLSIFFSMKPEEWVQLFEFIGNHARTLKSLHIRCLCGENDCRRSDLRAVSQIESLKKLNLRSLYIRSL